MSDAILSKVRKLLRLSTSTNPNEAAAAAAAAQRLIHEHHLADALLTLDTAETTAAIPDEPIRNFDFRDPLEGRGRWAERLASVIATANACKVYTWGRGGPICVIGRPSDVETVRYLQVYVVAEIERLMTAHRGHGHRWLNNWRLGCVDAICEAFIAEREAFESEARAGLSLVRVNQGLALVSQRMAATVAWQKAHVKLTNTRASYTDFNTEARAQGRTDGRTISISRPRVALVNGRALS